MIRKAFEPTKYDIEFIQDMFLAKLSPQGCNQREIEEAI